MQDELKALESLITDTIREKSLTTEQVNRLTGVSKPTIINIMKGRSKNPNAATLMALANGLGIPKTKIRKAIE